jgi:hypothetical protein
MLRRQMSKRETECSWTFLHHYIPAPISFSSRRAGGAEEEKKEKYWNAVRHQKSPSQ